MTDNKAALDSAYKERNQVVAALAKCFPSGVAKTAIEGWDEEWHNCVYIDLPTGQVSWHFHDRDAYLFEGIPPYSGKWDGHTTPEKYERLHALTTQPAPTDSAFNDLMELIPKEHRERAGEIISDYRYDAFVQGLNSRAATTVMGDDFHHNEWRIKAIRELGFTHRMEDGDHVVEGLGRVFRHTSLFCLMSRIVPSLRAATQPPKVTDAQRQVALDALNRAKKYIGREMLAATLDEVEKAEQALTTHPAPREVVERARYYTQRGRTVAVDANTTKELLDIIAALLGGKEG